MSDGLRMRGHEVEMVTFSRQYPKLLFPGTSQLEPGGALEKDEYLELIDSINPLTWIRAARAIRSSGTDAVIFQYWLPFFAPAFGAIAGRLEGIRRIGVLHNVLPHERRPGDVVLGRYFLGRCDGFISLSRAVGEDLRRLGIDAPLVTTAHPVYRHFGDPVPKSEARRALDLADDDEVILFFGFIRRYKGLHTLIEAMPEIVRRRPKVRLVVAGEFYEDENRLREMIEALRVYESVRLHSTYIPAERVSHFFSATDVVVQPYESATQSGVVQTAFHFERPVIVTDVGGLAEVVPHEKAGLVVPPSDPRVLGEAVVRFFQEDLGERLAAGVRLQKESNSWDHFVALIETMLTN